MGYIIGPILCLVSFRILVDSACYPDNLAARRTLILLYVAFMILSVAFVVASCQRRLP